MNKDNLRYEITRTGTKEPATYYYAQGDELRLFERKDDLIRYMRETMKDDPFVLQTVILKDHKTNLMTEYRLIQSKEN